MFERIRKQIEEIKENTNISAEDKKGILKVAEYLLTRNDMDEKYNNPEKTLLEMWEFIKDEAREKATNGVAILDDEEVYSIAIHYFDESNEDLKIKSKTTKVSKKSKKATAEESNVSKENEVTKQDEIPQKVDNEVGVPAHNDDEIAMIYKGRAVTYKEVREGQIFAKG